MNPALFEETSDLKVGDVYKFDNLVAILHRRAFYTPGLLKSENLEELSCQNYEHQVIQKIINEYLLNNSKAIDGPLEKFFNFLKEKEWTFDEFKNSVNKFIESL